MAQENARKKTARRIQKSNPGLSYTAARRRAARCVFRPLTATLGYVGAGKSVQVNLDEVAAGGQGPHCAIVADDAAAALMVTRQLLQSLVAGQSDRAINTVSVGWSEPVTRDDTTGVDIGELAGWVDQIRATRHYQLRALGCASVREARQAGNVIPTIMLPILLPHRVEPALTAALHTVLCVGRALGVHVVTVTAAGSPASGYAPGRRMASMPPPVQSNATVAISVGSAAGADESWVDTGDGPRMFTTTARC